MVDAQLTGPSQGGFTPGEASRPRRCPYGVHTALLVGLIWLQVLAHAPASSQNWHEATKPSAQSESGTPHPQSQ